MTKTKKAANRNPRRIPPTKTAVASSPSFFRAQRVQSVPPVQSVPSTPSVQPVPSTPSVPSVQPVPSTPSAQSHPAVYLFPSDEATHQLPDDYARKIERCRDALEGGKTGSLFSSLKKLKPSEINNFYLKERVVMKEILASLKRDTQQGYPSNIKLVYTLGKKMGKISDAGPNENASNPLQRRLFGK